MKRARKKNCKRKLLWSKDEEKEERETCCRFITKWKKMFLFVPLRVFSVEKKHPFHASGVRTVTRQFNWGRFTERTQIPLRGIFNCVTAYIFDMVASQRVCTPENGSSMPIILIVFLSHPNPCFETEKDISFAIVPLSSKILHQLPTRITWGDPFIRLWDWKMCNFLVLLLPVMYWIRAYLAQSWRVNPICAIKWMGAIWASLPSSSQVGG